MKLGRTFLVASALTVLFAGNAFARDTEKRALYNSVVVANFFTLDMIADLHVTPQQQQGLEASKERRHQIWVKYSQDMGRLSQSKLPEREKNARMRGLETQVSADLIRVYGETLRPEQIKRMKQIALQIKGMEIFDHPEVREALKIGDKEVRVLHAAYDKLNRELATKLKADLEAKKITPREYEKKALAMTFSVPGQVRESLSKEQKRVLEDLLGEKHVYR